MATTAITNKDEFINVTSGWLGVVEINHENRAIGTSVEPGGSCFLNEEEQILTANAPRLDADNPFANGSLKLARRALEVRNRRPFGGVESIAEQGITPSTEPLEETGATPVPDTEPEVGTLAPGEEVATPAATTAATTAATAAAARRRRAR